MMLQFEQDFTWGAATASYQIEGAYKEDGKGESIWDRFSHIAGNVENGDTGDIACNHYHRLEEDVNIMKELGLKCYRFSISWPRIFPQGFGTPNEKGTAFYKRLIALLKEKGIQPAITLYHWDLPQNLQDMGGWVNPAVTDYFEQYCRYIYRQFGEDVPLWITLNEPFVFTILGYGLGMHAPGHKDMKSALKAAHNAVVAHGKAVKAYREMGLKGEIGITLNMGYNYPETESEQDSFAAKLSHQNVGGWFGDPVLKGTYPKELMELYKSKGIFPDVDLEELKIANQPIDFLGINYYTSNYIKWDENVDTGRLGHVVNIDKDMPKTEMGWKIIPRGLEDLLLKLHKDYNGIKIYITENGAATNDIVDEEGRVRDEKRKQYLEQHFAAMHSAIQKGVKLKGYFLWSLMDNFEWAYGYSKRFGIVHVDYTTLKRTIKDSARWYSEVIKNNGF
jgi:beta-glucosidase